MFEQASSFSHSETLAEPSCSSPTPESSVRTQTTPENLVIQGFIEMLLQDMHVLEVKVNREDALTVASVAYRIKARAKALGIHSIQRSADQIETCARRNQISQLSAEIDLMRHQVELFVRSCGQHNQSQRVESSVGIPC